MIDSPSFVDTNVLVYAFGGDDPKRAQTAQTLIRSLAVSGALRTSTQVLQEAYVTLTRKVKSPIDSEKAIAFMDAIAKFPVVLIDYPAIREAAATARRDQLSFWDSLILVSAQRSSATVLYTEGMQHGRRIHGLQIINPFR